MAGAFRRPLEDLERVKTDFPSKAPAVDALADDIRQKMGTLLAAQIAHAVSQALRKAEQVDAEVERLDDSMDSDLLTDAGLQAHSRLKSIEKELKKLVAEFGEDCPKEYIQQTRDKIAECREKVNRKCLGIE